jgi:hypothetical protein
MLVVVSKKAVLVASLVMFAASCGGDKSSVNPDAAADRCSGAITVTVSSGAAPAFSWSPACKATNLTVIRADAPATDPAIWAVGREPNQFGPGVQYGVAPAGSVVFVAPAPLQKGVRYQVAVFATIGEDAVMGSGSAVFVP